MELTLCGLTALLAIYLLYKFVDHIMRLPRVDNNSDRFIFITGCDSGFGNALAKRLDSLGCRVFAGCFTEKGETELKKICSERLQPMPLDVTNRDSIRRAFELVSGKLQSTRNGKGTAAPPNFRPMSVVAKQLGGSRCHFVWR